MGGSGTARTLNLTLRVWRQQNRRAQGRFVTYEARDISTDMSFLEMLDVVNEALIQQGEEPIAFDHDCREGIYGQCGVVINGSPHGPRQATTACQLHIGSFQDGDVLTLEPWRAAAFPVIKDLMVDRSAFDRIIAAGGFISVRTGNAPDGNALPVPKDDAELAMDASACIGCGACVAACPNASAVLFVGTKVAHLNLLPQGQPERHRRIVAMVHQMDAEGFGSCTNHGECEAACPKEIRIEFIARLNRDYLKANFFTTWARDAAGREDEHKGDWSFTGGWADWTLAEEHADFLRFVRQMIALRMRYPALRRRTFFRGGADHPPPDIVWHGVELCRLDFSGC